MYKQHTDCFYSNYDYLGCYTINQKLLWYIIMWRISARYPSHTYLLYPIKCYMIIHLLVIVIKSKFFLLFTDLFLFMRMIT